jgi:hypothetical protein
MTQDSMPSPERAPPSAAAVGGTSDGAAPPPHRPRELLGWQLSTQSAACATIGSPLYAHLLAEAAVDVERGGPSWTVLEPHVAPGRGDALALRFMAAVHRLVLTRVAPALALHYPSVGGTADDGEAAWRSFRDAVEEHADDLRDLVGRHCQTNEVGRAAALVGGFLAVARSTGLPLRVLEVGASAGLNLHWDRFRYGGGGSSWGPPGSPVDLTGLWSVPPPLPSRPVAVAVRRGCDRSPVDPTSAEGRLALSASVWADQVDRLARLGGALAIASEHPITVDAAPLEVWLAQQLAARTPHLATVVVHSVVEEYLPAGVRSRFHAVLAEAGRTASPAAPLAWLRLEPVTSLRSHGLRLTTWPSGEDRVLARCGPHGQDVRWHEPESGLPDMGGEKLPR